jgi:calcineurin-like phosphoesterase family protein
MTTFFTSDTHFSHARIIDLCNRPFGSVTEMNEMLVHNWNALVRPDDTVYHLGDVALGPIEDSLKYIQRLNGYKILVVGNHDRMFPPMAKNKPEKIAHWELRYIQAGFEEILPDHVAQFSKGEYQFELSHFPYSGDSHGEERYREFRKEDKGVPLIHGHTHENKRFSRSRRGTPQIHVGVDAWDFAPVSLQAVIDVLDKES